MPLAAGFVGILPALGLLDEKTDGTPPLHLTWIAAVGWSCSVAFFGYDLQHNYLLLMTGSIKCLPLPPNPQTGGMCICPYAKADDRFKEQIVEEQLAFPSGTATAQLISVLHQLPPPDTSIRRRTAYSELATDEAGHDDIVVSTTTDDRDDDENNERRVAQQEGWQSLTWSFVASSVMTVSALTARFFSLIGKNRTVSALTARFFPIKL